MDWLLDRTGGSAEGQFEALAGSRQAGLEGGLSGSEGGVAHAGQLFDLAANRGVGLATGLEGLAGGL